MMKISQLEKLLAELKQLAGDVDVLDEKGYNIVDVKVRKAFEGELKFWGMDPKQEYLFAELHREQ